jgi:uncharacterized BrkB/YihY/UPF0761 family membrane protein
VSDEALRQTIVDEEHLRLLSIGYFVSSGITAFFSLFGLLYVFLGAMMGLTFSEAAKKSNQSPPPAFLGWILAIVGLVVFLFLITMAVLKFLTARYIQKRRSRAFCMVVAAISCLEIPYGTLLGVFTFIAVGRNSVKDLFEPRTPPLQLAK